MKQIVRNPLFYLSVALALVIGFMAVNFVGAFTEPGAAFPGGAPAAPLDASGLEQSKPAAGQSGDGTLNLKHLRLVDGQGGITSPIGICLKDSSAGSVSCKAYWDQIGAGGWAISGDNIHNTNTGGVAIGSTDPGTYKLRVEGTAFSTGGWESSDVRLKKNVEGLTGVLNKVLNLTGVYYDWRTSEYPTKGLPEGRQIGLIAQEVEKVFPELVNTDNDGYKALAYDKLTAILLEAIKEQQAEIENLKLRLQKLENSSN